MFNIYNKSIVILNKVYLQKHDMKKRIGLDPLRTGEFHTQYVHVKFKDNLVPWTF